MTKVFRLRSSSEIYNKDIPTPLGKGIEGFWQNGANECADLYKINCKMSESPGFACRNKLQKTVQFTGMMYKMSVCIQILLFTTLFTSASQWLPTHLLIR